MPGNIINLKPSDIAQWPAPNYDNPVERNWMPVYASVFYGASTIMVGMRIWLRISKYSGGFGTDDAILICSWLCVTAFTVLAIVGAEVFHTNRHLWVRTLRSKGMDGDMRASLDLSQHEPSEHSQSLFKYS